MAQIHAMPRELERIAKGQYKVRGAELQIVQAEDGKWRAEGDGTESLKPMKSRGQVLDALRELKLVPDVPAEQPKPAKAEKPAEQPTVLDPGDASGASGANGATEKPAKRRPRARKPAKAAATA